MNAKEIELYLISQLEYFLMKFSKSHNRSKKSGAELSFGITAMSALGISVIADALDYAGAPIFALPVIGDIADLVVTGLLYRLTGSKVSVFINATEFIPFIGDFVPTYTISTLLWILNESRKQRSRHVEAHGGRIWAENNTDRKGAA